MKKHTLIRQLLIGLSIIGFVILCTLLFAYRSLYNNAVVLSAQTNPSMQHTVYTAASDLLYASHIVLFFLCIIPCVYILFLWLLRKRFKLAFEHFNRSLDAIAKGEYVKLEHQKNDFSGFQRLKIVFNGMIDELIRRERAITKQNNTLSLYAAELEETQRIARICGFSYDIDAAVFTTHTTCFADELGRGLFHDIDGLMHIVRTEDRNLLRYAFDTCIATGTPIDISVRVTKGTKDIYIHIRATKKVCLNSSHMLIGTFQNITDVVSAQQKLDHLTKKQEALLHIPIIGFAYVEQKKFQWSNTAFDVMFGYASGGCLNQDPQMLCGETLFRDATMANGFVSRDMHISTTDVPTWLRVYATPIANNQNGYLLVVMDISRQKAMEENLHSLILVETEKRIAQEKIIMQQSKLAMMGEMISAIAHQWRQPLNALGLTIQDVFVAYKRDELTYHYLETFTKKSMDIIAKMSQTIDDFRHFFKPEQSKNTFYIKESIDGALAIIGPQLRLHGIAIHVQCGEQSTLYGYRSGFEQVLLIILANAQDAFDESKHTSPTIDIIVTKEEHAMSVHIIDNGGGIPPAIAERIFEPYFTTKQERNGTGIGLYIAKQIIETQMNGSLEVCNVTGGACFCILLPDNAS